MSSLDLADELQARADAMRAVGHLEEALIAARAIYSRDQTPENLAIAQQAAVDLRAARAASRTEGVTVGGDAYRETEA